MRLLKRFEQFVFCFRVWDEMEFSDRPYKLDRKKAMPDSPGPLSRKFCVPFPVPSLDREKLPIAELWATLPFVLTSPLECSINKDQMKPLQKLPRLKIVEPLIPPQFPNAWRWFFDDALSSWVKNQYSPKESWKNKPFTQEDSRFFFKGIEDLSLLFTEERGNKIQNYFQHPKYRSAYLLYFLPLQAAKFITLFEQHSKTLKKTFISGKDQPLHIHDFGAGPLTASLALLLWLLKQPEECPRIEIHASDLNATILKDGKEIAQLLISHFPKLREKITIHIEPKPWWEVVKATSHPISLSLMGNMLNESHLPPILRDDHSSQWLELWQKLFHLQEPVKGSLLIIEPASRVSSQKLSRLRNRLFETEILSPNKNPICGPCLHCGLCPLTEGRDWCHFSVPASIPGEWFLDFSKKLGSERHWLKYSYLWLSHLESPSAAKNLRRVISDPMEWGPASSKILLCEPEKAFPFRTSAGQKIRRGDLAQLPR